MNHAIISVGFCCVVFVISLAQADDSDLFSQVRTESVFTPTSPASPPPARQETRGPELEVKLSSIAELSRKLESAGFTVEEDSENRMVSTEVTRGRWTFPLLLVLAEDQSQLTLALLLSSTESEESISKSQLLELLQANRNYAPASFGYSSKRKRTELYHVLPNRLISARLLREQIDRLAEIAVETEQIWNLKRTPSSLTGTSTGTSAGTETSSAPRLSLVGKWVAARSAEEAFAIEFLSGGSFQLVYVKGTQQSRSSGTYTLQGLQLTLEGSDGLKLTGTVEQRTGERFNLQLGQAATGSTPLTFQRPGAGTGNRK